MDTKVKIRGFSIEPEAVENSLLSHPNVAECIVIARPGLDGEPRLLAYLAPRRLPAPTTSELRGYLKTLLPEYMLPARFVTLDSLPRNLNGKVERRLLPAPGRQRPALAVPFIPPASELQAQLAGLWGEILEMDEVGVDDSFFELGGDSLSALGLSLQVESRYGHALPMTYFKNPTIVHLERLLQDTALEGMMDTRITPLPRQAPPLVYSLRDRKKKGSEGKDKGDVYPLVVRLVGGSLRGSYHLLAAIGLGRPFYQACACLLHMLCGRAWFARRWKKVTRAHQQFLAQFFNRKRNFPAGFADLALLTGAEVIPIPSALNTQGLMEITIHPPLIRGDGDPLAQILPGRAVLHLSHAGAAESNRQYCR